MNKPYNLSKLTPVAAAVALSLGTIPSALAEVPQLKLPFKCGEKWKVTCNFGCNPTPSLPLTREGDSRFALTFETADAIVETAETAEQPILAAADGIATAQGDATDPYGYQVIVDHGDEVATRYANLAAPGISGEVKQGEVIGYAGINAENSHSYLHFTLLEKGVSSPPWPLTDQVWLRTGEVYASDNCPDSPSLVKERGLGGEVFSNPPHSPLDRREVIPKAAVTTCVATAAALRSALYTAGNNNQDDVIQLVQGTYTGNYTYSSTQAFSITVQGGYVAGCASRVLNATNTIIDGNKVAMALAIASSMGNVMVEGLTILNGKRTATDTNGCSGGGLYVFTGIETASISIQRNRIENNQATGNGGGVCINAKTATLSNNIITGNTTIEGSGGGVNFHQPNGIGTLVMNGNTVTNNTGHWEGGGINAIGTTITLNNNTVSNNSTGRNGGGISISATTANLTNNIIRSNHATGGEGGGASLGALTATLKNNTFDLNTGYTGGGITFCGGTDIDVGHGITLNNNIFSGNTALYGDGGGAKLGFWQEGWYSCHVQATMNKNAFLGNKSTGSGGGLLAASYVSLTNNTINGNIASIDGGGVHIRGGHQTWLNNSISGNKTGVSGGGAMAYGENADAQTFTTFINNSFNANSAAKGAGLNLILPSSQTSQNTLANNIFWTNIDATEGLDLWISNDVDNDFFPTPLTLLANNFDQSYPNGMNSSLPFDIDPSNLDKVDPLFVDAATHNLHLTAASPMIDAGDSTVEDLPTIDFDGGPRVHGTKVDIGADEYGSQAPATPPTATTTAATAITAISVSLNGMVNDNGADTTVNFDFGPTINYGTVITAIPATIAAGSGNKTVTANKTGLTCGGTLYNYRVRAENSGGTTNGFNQTFKTAFCPPQAPTVTSVAATAVTTNSATLNGTVASSAAATASFELGLTDKYGTSVTATPAQIVSAAPVTIAGNAVDLACATPYYFRATAFNSIGTGNGSGQTFTTLPCPTTATTAAATNVAAHSATLNGQVNGGGIATTVTFDLGTSLAYGISVPATPTGFSGDSPVTANKTGLSCNTLYHYRTKAVNSKGEVFGEDQIFTTGLICAETPSVRLNPPAPIVKVNRQFNLDVLVNTNGLKLGAYNFTIGFDQTKVVVDKTYQDQSGQCIQGVCPGIDMPAPTNVITDNDNGIVQVVGLSVTGLGPSNDLPLLAMHLQARNTTGDTPMSLTINELVTATQPATTIGDGAAAGATVKVINYDCGDADGNGLVNIVDALAVARNVIGLPPPPTVGPAADVNGDGQIKIVDAMNIARYAVGLLVVDTCFEQ